MTVTGLLAVVVVGVVVGVIVGVLTWLVVPGRSSLSVWLTMTVGAVGALGGLVVAITGISQVLVLISQVVGASIATATVAGIHGRRSRRRLQRLDVPAPPAVAYQQGQSPPSYQTPYREPPRGLPSKVFLCYRRDDEAFAVRLIAEALTARFGRAEVFIDVDSIPYGDNFYEAMQRAISSSAVVVVVIGAAWLNARDELGAQRLSKSEDAVRIEIELALQHNRPVLPVLIESTRMPRPDQLPGSLRPLAARNALRARHESWSDDMARLLNEVQRHRARAVT